MADTLALQHTAAISDTFQSRVEIAMVATAITIQTEPDKSNRGNRLLLSRSCLIDSSKYVRGFALAVASQGLDDSSTDVELRGMVNVVWDAIAGGA